MKKYDLNTLLLLHLDNNINDYSVYNWNIQEHNNITFDPNIKKFGSSSLHLENNASLTINSRLFPPLRGFLWTFEFFIYIDNLPSTDQYLLGVNSKRFYMTISSRQLKWFGYNWSCGFQLNNPLNKGLTLNQWHHIAFSFRSGDIYLWIDGDRKSYNRASSDNSWGWYLSNQLITIGAPSYDATANCFNGWLSEFRLQNNFVYPFSFKPPTEPFSPYLKG